MADLDEEMVGFRREYARGRHVHNIGRGRGAIRGHGDSNRGYGGNTRGHGVSTRGHGGSTRGHRGRFYGNRGRGGNGRINKR